jgi:hypothetical protein
MAYDTGRRVQYKTSVFSSLQQQIDEKLVQHHITMQRDLSWRQQVGLAKAVIEKLIKGLDDDCDDDYRGLLAEAESSVWECGEIYDEEEFDFQNRCRAREVV